jgi:glucans biosynthesis protein
MQRKRSYSDFLDLEAGYERRPGGWVIPQGDWPAGAVELIELPIGAEWGDNIVCQWRLTNPLEPGSSLRFAYRLAWTDDIAARVRRVTDTRIGATNQRKLFVVDYAPYSSGEEPVGAVVTATAGAVSRPIVQRNRHTGGVRCFFSFTPPVGGRADLSAVLVGSDGDPNGPVARESEQWTYRLIQ